MGLTLSVYRSAEFGDCTNGGATATCKTITVVNIDGPSKPTKDSPAFKLTKGPYNSLRLVPVDDPREKKGAGPMMGGNYAATSDSRFGEACRKLLGTDFYGAVAVHDRYETWERYNLLST